MCYICIVGLSPKWIVAVLFPVPYTSFLEFYLYSTHFLFSSSLALLHTHWRHQQGASAAGHTAQQGCQLSQSHYMGIVRIH